MSGRFLGYITDRIRSSDPSKSDHAKVRIAAIKNPDTGNYEKLNDEQKKMYGPPEGEIFCPNFYSDRNDGFNRCSFVEFSITPSQKKVNVFDQTDYKIDYPSSPKGINLPRLIPYEGKLKKIIENRYLSPKELNERIDKQKVFNGEDISFFLYDRLENLALGMFNYKASSNEIISAYGKEVQNFTLESNLVVSDSKNYSYVIISKSHNNLTRGSLIDFMDDQQLSDWFSKRFGDVVEVNKQAVANICNFSEIQSQEDNLDLIRFERIKSKAEAIDLDIQKVVEIVCIHKNYFSEFTDKVDIIKKEVETRLSKEFLDNAPETISANKEKIDSQRKEISEQQNKIDALKEEYKNKAEINQERIKKEAEKLEVKITKKQKQLDGLNKDYDTVLTTLSAALPLFNMNNRNSKAQNESTSPDSDILTPTVFPADGLPYKELQEKNDESVKSLLLRNIGGTEDSPLSLVTTAKYVLNYKACFVPCVSWGFIFAKAIRNAEVYTIHVEYDWLHYEDYCRHGLLEPYKKAHNTPAQNYILILDGLNITQPECGLRPLLNLISGTEPVLQGYAVPFPKNLTIFATLLPTSGENPIGLKLKPEYFSKWGAFGSPANPDDVIPLPDEFYDLVTKDAGYFNSSDLQLPEESICATEDLKVYFDY